jgi:hypothetical protein
MTKNREFFSEETNIIKHAAGMNIQSFEKQNPLYIHSKEIYQDRA